jgi:molecular chaperone GrpE
MQEGERAQTQPGPQPQTDAAAPAGLESASVSEVEAELQAALAKANENYERYVRAVADGENIRRRAQEDIAKAHKYGVESFARHLVPVVASLDQSLAALATGADPAALREGIELTRKQLLSAFEKGQITEINPAVGEKQDPRRHDAVAAVPRRSRASTRHGDRGAGAHRGLRGLNRQAADTHSKLKRRRNRGGLRPLTA